MTGDSVPEILGVADIEVTLRILENKPKTFEMAPAVGFEPTTNRLTADRSTTELRWIFFSRLRSVYLACAVCDGKCFLAVKKNAAGKQRPLQQNRSLLRFWLRGRDLNPRSGRCRIMSCLSADR